ALSLGSCIVTLAVQRNAVQSLTGFPAALRLENAAISCVRYLGRTVWPVNLALPYPYPDAWPLSHAIWAAAILLALCAAAFLCRKSRPYFFVGWFWFLGTLVPVIGLVQVGAQSMADRYTYIRLVGIFVGF